MENTHTDKPLSPDERRQLIADFNAEDQRLTHRLADMFKSGQANPAIVADRDAKAHAAAAKLLNGRAGAVLPKRRLEGETEADVIILRDAVRLILDALNRQSREAEAAAARELASTLAPEFKAICREWFAAAQKFSQLEAKARAFTDGAGPAVSDLLPLAGWIGAGFAIRDPWNNDLDDVQAAAKVQGVKI